jgi:molybdopterin-guanine dinucleotide biosynthesis protein A
VADAYDAVVLAGGSARRLGGVDKPALEVGGRALLDLVIAAVDDAGRVVVVGPRRTTERSVHWCRERPPGGGPVAALAAGLAEVRADLVVVLAGDLPFVTGDDVRVLLAATAQQDGAVAVDAGGRDQLLLGAWRTDRLRAALPDDPDGARLGAVIARLTARRVTLPAAGRPAPWFDCDTQADLTTARSTP